MQLGEILVSKKLLSQEQLNDALEIQHLHSSSSPLLGEILVDRGMVSFTDIQVALQEQRWRRKGYWIIG